MFFSTAYACKPALRSRQKHVFLFIFRRFLLILVVKSLKKVYYSVSFLTFNKEVNLNFVLFLSESLSEKLVAWTPTEQKTAEKVVWPAFGCGRHPKAGQNSQRSFNFKGNFLLSSPCKDKRLGYQKWNHYREWHDIRLKVDELDIACLISALRFVLKGSN